MNRDIDDVGYGVISRKLKNSCRNFDETGSAISIDSDSG